MKANRYHPLLVALHWILALLIIMGLLFGGIVLQNMPNDAEKITPLAIHMTVGLVIGALIVLRLITRFTTVKPLKAGTGNALLDRLGSITHFLLYFLMIAMVSTGIGTAGLSGTFEAVFAGTGSLPASFEEVPPKAGHELFSLILAGLIVLHLLAALYHHFALHDGLFRRMWFSGKPRLEQD